MIKATKSEFFQPLRLFLSLLLLFCLIACGGSADTADTGGDTGGDTTGTPTLTLTLSSTTVTFGTPITATATLRDASGTVVSGAVVTFASTSSLVAFIPSSATALTNTSGVATISVGAASIDSAGATYITASAQFTSGSETITVTSTPLGINVNAVSVTLGTITFGSSSISAYGTSSVSVPVYIGGSLATVPVSVTFSSACVSSGDATISSPVNSISGTATSTYKDNGCGTGSDVITASVTGDSESATITVSIPTYNNIQFVSANPQIIGTKTASTSSLPTSSLVKFKVVDSTNNGIPGILVDFTISPATAPGGITLSATSATSDSNGEVSVSLSSGTVPTPVWVVATIHGTSITSQSNPLTITTCLPAQNSFSLSAEKYNIEGWSYDKVSTQLNIVASDRLGNPVPDGTAINFVTPESGQINPASCTTTSGACSVSFISGGDRPTDGRATIISYAVGEKSFVDTNGNNAYDAGETFYDLGDLYIDYNENGVWDSDEQYYAPYSSAGSSACLTRPSGDPLPLTYDNVQSKENTCTATWGQNYVRRSAVILLSGSYADIVPTTVDMGSNCTQFFTLQLMDVNSNAMPAETTITTKDNDVYYIPNGSTALTAATVSIVGGTPVPSSTSNVGTPIVLRVKAGSDCLAATPVQYPQGIAFIEVTTPLGNITTIPITVTGDTP